MQQNKSAAPELHLLVLWHSGLSFHDAIQQEIIDRGFRDVGARECLWPVEIFTRNLGKFYGRKLDSLDKKAREIGTGPCTIFTFFDDAPDYGLRETSRGFERVNQNVFDLKTAARSITGYNCVHGTNSLAEARRDLCLLFGQDYEDIKRADRNGLQPRSALPGVEAWKNLAEVFLILNHCDDYVVLRNFDGLPEEVSLGTHGDIDMLSQSWERTRDLLSAKPLRDRVESRHFELSMASGRNIPIDIRSLHDGYYDVRWQKDILQTRIMQNGVYIPNQEHHRFSLIYHALIQKWYVSPDYAPAAGSDRTTGQPYSWEINLTYLHRFMEAKGYCYTRPADSSVGFDVRYTPVALSEQIDRIEKLGVSDVRPFKVDAWKNRFGCSYFEARTESGQRAFVKCGGLATSALREFRILQKLHADQPRLFPQPLRYSIDGKDNILVIGFIDGERLDQALRDQRYSAEDRQKIGHAMIDLLTCLHRHKIIHRDLRPENILIGADLNPVLIDFEFAISLSSPKFLEYRAIRKNIAQVKNLGGEHRAGRFWWDDLVSLKKILRDLEVTPNREFAEKLETLNQGETLAWFGRRNAPFDRLWVPIYNAARRKIVQRKQRRP
ncbi:MAG: RIO1 family regulatory kinase/ATPase [Pseudomonadota bacterium]